MTLFPAFALCLILLACAACYYYGIYRGALDVSSRITAVLKRRGFDTAYICAFLDEMKRL